MPKKKNEIPPKVIRYGFAVKEKTKLLMELLIPLPCLEYLTETGSCDSFECPSIDGEDPLCQTRRRLADQLALAIQINRYDALHPEYDKLPEPVKDLIVKARVLKHEDYAPPSPPEQKGKG